MSSRKRPSNAFSTQAITLNWSLSILYHVCDVEEWPPGHHQASCYLCHDTTSWNIKSCDNEQTRYHLFELEFWPKVFLKINGTPWNSKCSIPLSHNEDNFIRPHLSRVSPSTKDRATQEVGRCDVRGRRPLIPGGHSDWNQSVWDTEPLVSQCVQGLLWTHLTGE